MIQPRDAVVRWLLEGDAAIRWQARRDLSTRVSHWWEEAVT